VAFSFIFIVTTTLTFLQVAWIHYDKSAILTVQTTVITRNPRISVTHEGQKTWYVWLIQLMGQISIHN